jgi:hypothetical protein
MPGYMPKVPQQPNHCDCGIFTLFYVQCFFKNPMRSFEVPVRDNLCHRWFGEVWDNMRERIYNCVKELIGTGSNPENSEFIPKLVFPGPVIRKKALKDKIVEQVKAVPFTKLSKVEDEPMDVDVEDVSSSQISSVATSSGNVSSQDCTPSICDMARASDHDHDYTPIPPQSS